MDVERKRDVIELPLEGDLGINGWDLRKALHLLRKSNPPLLELVRLEQRLPQVGAQQCPVEALDGLFQLALAEVWG